MYKMRAFAACILVLTLGLVALPAFADPGGEPSDKLNSQARSLKPGTTWGTVDRKINDNPKALEACKRALEIKPDFKYAHEYIGRLYTA